MNKKLLNIKRIVMIIVIFVLPFLTVVLQGELTQRNYKVENIKIELKKQEKKNESLNMKKNELASLDKISDVAEAKGLSYNNNNIKNIVKLSN